MEKKNVDIKKSMAKKKFIDYLKKYNTFIEKRNLAFKKLPKNKRVVLLCEDAIYNIFSNIIRPLSGKYLVEMGTNEAVKNINPGTSDSELKFELLCEIKPEKRKKLAELKESGDFYDELEESQMQDVMALSSCDTCAKGGLMVSCISFKNKMTVSGLSCDFMNDYEGKLPAMLKGDFTQAEWDLIEICFECWSFFERDLYTNYKKFEKTISDYKREDKDDEDNFIFTGFGALYIFKHFNKAIEYLHSHYKEEADFRLFQLYANIIACGGDIYKALNLNNNRDINYDKIVKDIFLKYPYITTKKNRDDFMKKFKKFLRPKPLTYVQLKKELLITNQCKPGYTII